VRLKGHHPTNQTTHIAGLLNRCARVHLGAAAVMRAAAPHLGGQRDDCGLDEVNTVMRSQQPQKKVIC